MMNDELLNFPQLIIEEHENIGDLPLSGLSVISSEDHYALLVPIPDPQSFSEMNDEEVAVDIIQPLVDEIMRFIEVYRARIRESFPDITLPEDPPANAIWTCVYLVHMNDHIVPVEEDQTLPLLQGGTGDLYLLITEENASIDQFTRPNNRAMYN